MADEVTEVVGQVAGHVASVLANATNLTNVTAAIWDLSREELMTKFKEAGEEAEPGLILAYLALLVMAMIPIYCGSKASVHTEEEKKEAKEAGMEQEVMTNSDAAMFPVFASCALFGLYVMFKLVGKEYINLLLGGYFFLLGLLSLTSAIRPFVAVFCPESFCERPFDFSFKREGDPTAKAPDANEEDRPRLLSGEEPASPTAGEAAVKDEVWFEIKFDLVDVACFIVSAGVGVWYLATKHWIANNLFGLSFSYNGIALFSLGSFQTGCILLCGLFIYDVFWVFGTDVMVTVARSFDAPIKVLFPKDFMEHGVFATQHAMLGLGDIVLPGVLVALLLRFDVKYGRTSEPYFRATYIAYILGLVATIVIMHTFKAAQPALLYLVPACLITPLLLSVIRGETKELFSYDEAEEDQKLDEASKKDQ